MIKLTLFKKEIINGKSRFNRYFTFMNLPEEYGGELHQHGVTVKFVDELDLPKFAFKGTLVIEDEANDISTPRIYQIKKDKDGKDVYPVVWIRNFKSYTPKDNKEKNVATQSMFVVDEEETQEVEFES